MTATRTNREPAVKQSNRRLLQMAAALAVLLVGVLGSTLVPTATGSLSAAITNTTNTAASGIVAGPCTSNATATGSAYFIWPFDEATGATTARDTSGNARTGTYRNTSGIAFSAAGPCPKDNALAITLSGTSGSGGYVSQTSAAIAGPTTFTAAIWFKTTTTSGGKLIGFGNSQTGQSSSYDRHLYMTNSGTIIAGVYPGAVKTVASAATYNDNTWHYAAMSLASSGNQSGLRLYMDGSLVASDTSVTSAQSFNGFWHVGYDNISNWTNTPSSFYFAGSVAFASVYTTALTPTQISNLYNAGK